MQRIALACTIMLALHTTSRTETIFEKTDCENGFKGAYTVTGIASTGCIMMIVGVDCNGAAINWQAPIVSIPDDLSEPFTHYLSGTKDGRPWFAKVQLGLHGEVRKAWGQMTDGTYYQIPAIPNP